MQVTVAKSVKSTKKNDSDDELVFVTHEIALVSESVTWWVRVPVRPPGNYQYIQKQKYVNNITKTDDAISVGGVGGILDVDKIDELPEFGRVYYSLDGIANILFCHDRASKELISFDKERNVFI